MASPSPEYEHMYAVSYMMAQAWSQEMVRDVLVKLMTHWMHSEARWGAIDALADLLGGIAQITPEQSRPVRRIQT
jgi:hypothetical protein